jgi:hypothetical protein
MTAIDRTYRPWLEWYLRPVAEAKRRAPGEAPEALLDAVQLA